MLSDEGLVWMVRMLSTYGYTEVGESINALSIICEIKGIMLTTSLVMAMACSALALCISKHVPRIVEVFIIKMKVGDPGNDQL